MYHISLHPTPRFGPYTSFSSHPGSTGGIVTGARHRCRASVTGPLRLSTHLQPTSKRNLRAMASNRIRSWTMRSRPPTSVALPRPWRCAPCGKSTSHRPCASGVKRDEVKQLWDGLMDRLLLDGRINHHRARWGSAALSDATPKKDTDESRTTDAVLRPDPRHHRGARDPLRQPCGSQNWYG